MLKFHDSGNYAKLRRRKDNFFYWLLKDKLKTFFHFAKIFKKQLN